MRDPESYRAARRNQCREVLHSKPGASWHKIWVLFETPSPKRKQNRYARKSAQRWGIKSETLQQIKG